MNNNCNICPRNCDTNRSLKIGFCGTNNDFKIGRADLHFWEEPIISGKLGSGAIFFSGCNLRCVFCQNHSLSHKAFGKTISKNELISAMKRLENLNAHNINFVTPSHYSEALALLLDEYKPKIPVVFNSNGYEKPCTLKLLENKIDIYLPDFKFASEELAQKYSMAKNYPKVAILAIKEMLRQQPTVEIKDGIMQKGVMIRHLVLPNNLQNTYSTLDLIKANFGTKCYISLMSQYTPCGDNLPVELQSPLKPLEYKLAQNYADKLGFENGYYQGISSASKSFIPNFYD